MMDAGREMGNERYDYMIPYGYGYNEGRRDAKEQEGRKRGGVSIRYDRHHKLRYDMNFLVTRFLLEESFGEGGCIEGGKVYYWPL